MIRLPFVGVEAQELTSLLKGPPAFNIVYAHLRFAPIETGEFAGLDNRKETQFGGRIPCIPRPTNDL
jgi:hypothetical protein